MLPAGYWAHDSTEVVTFAVDMAEVWRKGNMPSPQMYLAVASHWLWEVVEY